MSLAENGNNKKKNMGKKLHIYTHDRKAYISSYEKPNRKCLTVVRWLEICVTFNKREKSNQQVIYIVDIL